MSLKKTLLIIGIFIFLVASFFLLINLPLFLPSKSDPLYMTPTSDPFFYIIHFVNLKFQKLSEGIMYGMFGYSYFNWGVINSILFLIVIISVLTAIGILLLRKRYVFTKPIINLCVFEVVFGVLSYYHFENIIQSFFDNRPMYIGVDGMPSGMFIAGVFGFRSDLNPTSAASVFSERLYYLVNTLSFAFAIICLILFLILLIMIAFFVMESKSYKVLLIPFTSPILGFLFWILIMSTFHNLNTIRKTGKQLGKSMITHECKYFSNSESVPFWYSLKFSTCSDYNPIN